MKEKFPIVMMDRTTMQEVLPIVLHKGIFTNNTSLPIKEEILETERKRLGVTELAPDHQRNFLASIGQYRTENYIVRDFGDYAIVFNAAGFTNAGNIEEEVLDKKPDDEKISEALGKVRLFRLAHRLLVIILSKGYEKRKFKQLEITKQEILDLLGFTSADKHIYRDISDALFSLTLLNYRIYRFRNRIKHDKNFKIFGNFIYNVVEDSKGYIIDVNENFVGCVTALLRNKEENSIDDFSRTYFQYPTSIIPATRKYSTAAYLLANYLISEEGNKQLNEEDYKIVAFSVWRFMLVMNIKSSRASKRKAEFLKALKEVEIISEISPSVAELTNTSPSKLEETVIHIKVKSDVKDLDSDIKSNLLGAKVG